MDKMRGIRYWVLLPALLLMALTSCSKYVVILVDPALEKGIRPGLDQYEADLKKDCYKVIEKVSTFSSPQQLRTYLGEVYAQTDRDLIGVLLIGDMPHAYQQVTLLSANPSIPSSKEEVISFQYYADLDGNFGVSSGYVSPGGHPYSFDLHNGNVNWEIWVGVLPLYKGDYGKTTDALNRYFKKNHSYRTGTYTVPHGFLEINEHSTANTTLEEQQILANMKTGTYAWTPFSSAPGARLYFNSVSGGLSVDQGYQDLSTGVADFTVTDTHGWWKASGKIDITWVEGNPVKTVFFWSNGCAVGDLDHLDNFLTSVLYSPTSSVLVAKGTTNNSGGMGNNSNGSFGHNIATSLTKGTSFGRAILDHVNVPLAAPWSGSREFHYATPVILGDPTLRLTP